MPGGAIGDATMQRVKETSALVENRLAIAFQPTADDQLIKAVAKTLIRAALQVRTGDPSEDAAVIRIEFESGRKISQ